MNFISKEKLKKANWPAIIYLVGVPLLVLSLTPIAFSKLALFSPWMLLYVVIHYSIDTLSITAGYHRRFSHKSYEASPIVDALYLILGASAVQNSALVWSIDHRAHHSHVDGEKDPYSIRRGFAWAHFFWMFKKQNPIYSVRIPKDLQEHQLVMWQHKFYLPLALLMTLGIPVIFFHFVFQSALWGVFLGAGIRLLLSSHCTFLINSAAHTFGTRPFTDENSARDNPILAFLTFGEGYHNFHHKFQNDFRNGIKWFQWDPTKWTIQLLAKLKLASKLKRTPQEKILKARIFMQEKKALLKTKKDFYSPQLKLLKAKFESSVESFSLLRKEFEVMKSEKKAHAQKNFKALQKRLKAQQKEMKLHFKELYLALNSQSYALSS